VVATFGNGIGTQVNSILTSIQTALTPAP